MSEVDDLIRSGLNTTPDLPGPGEAKGSTPAVPARPDNPIRILNYQQMMQMPAPAWLIEGILPERALTLMFGTSNSFKSFLAVNENSRSSYLCVSNRPQLMCFRNCFFHR